MGGEPGQRAGEEQFMRINIFENTALDLAEKAVLPQLKLAVETALRKKACATDEVNIVLVDGEEIKRLNTRYLRHRRLTDVIAFNYPRPSVRIKGDDTPFGDICICVEVARRQAVKYGHAPAFELLILATHGALHLAGMDDSTPALRQGMDEATAALIAQLKPPSRGRK